MSDNSSSRRFVCSGQVNELFDPRSCPWGQFWDNLGNSLTGAQHSLLISQISVWQIVFVVEQFEACQIWAIHCNATLLKLCNWSLFKPVGWLRSWLQTLWRACSRNNIGSLVFPGFVQSCSRIISRLFSNVFQKQHWQDIFRSVAGIFFTPFFAEKYGVWYLFTKANDHVTPAQWKCHEVSKLRTTLLEIQPHIILSVAFSEKWILNNMPLVTWTSYQITLQQISQG